MNHVVSRILCLPFVNAPASSYDTLYTVLLDSHERCNELKRHICITFDQPLYAKAREILACCPKFNNIIIRLGGFHLLLSYTGSIGYIMKGSGLKEILSLIYAPGSIDKMLEGHSYARTVRAFTLLNAVLVSILLDEMNNSDYKITDEEKICLNELITMNPLDCNTKIK